MSVDRSSSEYMFGQIIARLNEGDKVIAGLVEKVDAGNKAVYNLPCHVHEERLKELEKFKNDCNEQGKEQVKSSLSLKTGLIIAAFTTIISAAVGAIMKLI